jgi:hypothetical protein
MGFFKRRDSSRSQRADLSLPQKRAPAPARFLPRDVVTTMRRYGRHKVDPYTSGEPSPLDAGWAPIVSSELEFAARAEPARYVSAIAEAVLPGGGWAVYGGAEFALDVWKHDLEQPAYRSLFVGGLMVRREAKVPWSKLNGFDQSYWSQHHEGEPWLPVRVPPTREAASIAPLAVGEERPIAKLLPTNDSTMLFAARTHKDRYVMILETEDDSGKRVRGEKFEANTLYDVYYTIGHRAIVHYWNDPQFEPFCQDLWPQL